MIENGDAIINVELNKTSSFIEMEFNIKGTVQLVCDRSLEVFSEEVENNHKMLFKYGDHDEELSDEIVLIDRDTQRINIAHYIYEFMSLDIPMKKIHPKYRDEADEGIVFSSDDNEEEIENNDPRWDKLKGLLNKN